jgi:hypothetical protein
MGRPKELGKLPQMSSNLTHSKHEQKITSVFCSNSNEYKSNEQLNAILNENLVRQSISALKLKSNEATFR